MSKGMAWEFSRSGEWMRVDSPLNEPAQLDGESFDTYLARAGYREMYRIFDEDVLMAPTIYESSDTSSAYRYLVLVEKDGSSFEWIVCKDLPDLIELGSKLYPLWHMAYLTDIKENRDDDFTKKLFHALHGHSIYSSCWECDPDQMRRMEERRLAAKQRRDAKTA